MKEKKTTQKVEKAKTKVFKELLSASYNEEIQNVQGLVKDHSLSGKRVSVFRDPNSNKAYVVHRGTANLRDWFTDFEMALGYEGGSRFRHSQKIQEKAEQKYGAENVVTLGHSLGGRLAEKFGKNSAKTVTYNKAVTPRSIVESYTNPNDNQLDVRTTADIVSIGSKFQNNKDQLIQLEADTINPIIAHAIEQLKTTRKEKKDESTE